MKIMKNSWIPYENYENHEKLIISRENHENYENPRVPDESQAKSWKS